ncbi:hypothetical protein, partial [Achromobacter insuavis]|uniref:hypothetical protein n=1 Tax=Achromobacter insuavis TaxID=1287735 RepID=UPI0035A0A23E
MTAAATAACPAPAATGMARARATAIAAARRGRRPFAALRLLAHAVAVAGVAQRVVAVVGARTVARGRGIRALALG